MLPSEDTDLDEPSYSNSHENRGLISGNTKVPHDPNVDLTISKTFKCVKSLMIIAIFILVLIVCSVIIGAVIWWHITTILEPETEAVLNELERFTNNDTSLHEAVHLLLKNHSLETLLYHDEDSTTISDQERDILQRIFDYFDYDGDNLWNLEEFEFFIDTAVAPETKFSDIDFDQNDIVSFRELSLFLSTFYELDLYKCDRTNAIILEIFGYEYNDTLTDEPDYKYFEYMAHLWFKQLDPYKLGFIEKATYVKYVEDEEWDYHNKNNDAYIEVEEFIESVFDSIYYTSFRNWLEVSWEYPQVIDNITYNLNQFHVISVSEYELTLTPQLHAFDEAIAEYVDERPAESILYQLPHLYVADHFVDMFARRRRRLVITSRNLGNATCSENAATSFQTMWNGPCNKVKRNKVHFCADPKIDHHFWELACPDCLDQCPNCTNGAECRLCGEVLCVQFKNVAEEENCLDAIPYNLYETDTSKYYMERDKCLYMDWRESREDVHCFADSGMVNVQDVNSINSDFSVTKQLKDVNVGDYVFDGEEYSKVFYVKKRKSRIEMVRLILDLADDPYTTSITLTADHLLYDMNMDLVRAGGVKIGDRLESGSIVRNIIKDVYASHSTPLTMSGRIKVNNVTASCYTRNAKDADRAHNLLGFARFLSEYVSEEFTAYAYEMIHSDLSKIQTYFGYVILHPIFSENCVTGFCSAIWVFFVICTKNAMLFMF